MFARVSTYQTSADRTGEPSEETVKRVLELPGCRGIYYLKGDGNKALSITLWESAEAISGSREAAASIRTATSAEQHMEILAVEEFEVLTRDLKD
ncbi:hypothetical protein J7E82_20340 [Arthrobacter sp. ISL-30]|nr:hypothetical protein [Arthrobacter sp. ISL-30]